MTRIRYKTNGAQLVSTKPILCNNCLVLVTIDPVKLKYWIKDTNAKANLVEGIAPSLHAIKKKVTMDLKSLGATFLDEVRNAGTERKLIIEATNS